MSKTNKLKQTQLQLSQLIRKGDGHLPGIETRRVDIYKELFFNNIEGFCSTAFPITKRVIGSKRWLKIVRQFFIEAECESPHFIEISQTFLSFLITQNELIAAHPFICELAHYEWTELDLAVKFEEDNNTLLSQVTQSTPLVLSNVCVPLLYNFPVHTISDNNLERIAPQLTGVIVYRNIEYNVKFMLVDQLTIIVLQKIIQQPGITLLQLAEQLTELNDTFTFEQMQQFTDDVLQKCIDLRLLKQKSD